VVLLRQQVDDHERAKAHYNGEDENQTTEHPFCSVWVPKGGFPRGHELVEGRNLRNDVAHLLSGVS
jgi:hypothetical protein